MALHVRVRRTRPRVCVSEDNLPEIRRRIETTHVDEWSQLVVWSRGIAKTPPEHRLRPERLSERGKRLAFMYAVKPGDRTLEFALEVVPLLAAAKPTPPKVEALAQLFDALHEELPPATRQSVRDALYAGAHALFEEHVRGAPVLAERRSESVAAVFAAGLALFGDEDRAMGLLGSAVHASRDLTGTLVHFLEEDGGFPLGWPESFAHLGQLPKLALLAESGLAQGWPRQALWLERYAEFLLAGVRSLDHTGRDGPFWPGGGDTARRLDVWRVLAIVAGFTGNAAARRLLAAMPLRGCQDEKILFEVRDKVPAGGDLAPDGVRSAACFFRRAGLGLLRSDGGEAGLEVLVRCPSALFAGGAVSEAGTYSLAAGADLIVGGPQTPNVVSIAGATPPEGRDAPGDAYPHTRRELNAAEKRKAEVLAYESVEGVFDWMLLDLSRIHRADAESVTRAIVLLRRIEGWPLPVLVVYDEVRLKTPGGDVASTVHYAFKPEMTPAGVACEAAGARLATHVLLPSPHQTWIDEVVLPPTAAGPALSCWRLRISSKEGGARNTFCYAHFAAGTSERREPQSAMLPATGAVAASFAGTIVVFAREDLARIDAVTRDRATGIVIVGASPSAAARLEVSGEEPVQATASDAGSLHFDVAIPHATGFCISFRPAVGPGNGRISMRRRPQGTASAEAT